MPVALEYSHTIPFKGCAP